MRLNPCRYGCGWPGDVSTHYTGRRTGRFAGAAGLPRDAPQGSSPGRTTKRGLRRYLYGYRRRARCIAGDQELWQRRRYHGEICWKLWAVEDWPARLPARQRDRPDCFAERRRAAAGWCGVAGNLSLGRGACDYLAVHCDFRAHPAAARRPARELAKPGPLPPGDRRNARFDQPGRGCARAGC